MLYFLYFQRRNQRPTPDMRVVANKIPLASNKTEEFTARYFARRELKLPSSTRENRTTSCCIRGQGARSWYFTGRASKIPSVAANPRKYRNEVSRRLWTREIIRFAENQSKPKCLRLRNGMLTRDKETRCFTLRRIAKCLEYIVSWLRFFTKFIRKYYLSYLERKSVKEINFKKMRL